MIVKLSDQYPPGYQQLAVLELPTVLHEPSGMAVPNERMIPAVWLATSLEHQTRIYNSLVLDDGVYQSRHENRLVVKAMFIHSSISANLISQHEIKDVDMYMVVSNAGYRGMIASAGEISVNLSSKARTTII